VLTVLVVYCFFVSCSEANAGPGGQFVKLLFGTKLGWILGGLLLLASILLAPLLIYAELALAAGIRRTKKDLARLAQKYPWFEWPTIRKRVEAAVRRIGSVWASGDLTSAAAFMTEDYFTSQQELLSRWIDEGKFIVYRLDKVRKIEPLAVEVEDAENYSTIRVLVTVDCLDYMRYRNSSEVVKGKAEPERGFNSIWCLIHHDGQWLLNGIEDGAQSLVWATEKNLVDTKFLDSVLVRQPQPDRVPADFAGSDRSRSQSAPFDSPADQPAAQSKDRLVRKPTDDQDH
jgi:hypothetical protein